MKETFARVFLTAMLLSACNQKSSDSIQEPASGLAEDLQITSEDRYSFEGTVFRYDGHEYDISTRSGLINSIISCTPVGKYIVIEGHTGPKNNIYCIFNTETASFEPDIAGCHLIWHDDDITTAVYSFWSDVCTYDGSVLASYDLSEYEFIYDLEFIEDNSKLNVTIVAENDEARTETLKIPS